MSLLKIMVAVPAIIIILVICSDMIVCAFILFLLYPC